jgi:hypothetical protein
MIPVRSGVQVWLATGHTDMRKGFDGLAVLVQEPPTRHARWHWPLNAKKVATEVPCRLMAVSCGRLLSARP